MNRLPRLAALAAPLLALLSMALPSLVHAESTLLNASYDVAREFYREYNPLFVSHWKERTGESVTITQSHAGSSKQARAVIDGMEADVVTMNQAEDIEALADRGFVARDWSMRFPNNASPTYSTMLLVVRHGNPKGIRDWDDLAKPGVQVIIVNPKTGGNGRYAYLAAWGYAKTKGMSDADARQFIGRLLANVPVLESGGRAATATFVQRGIGDVLVTFESETLQIEREFGAGRVDVVYPSTSILAENPVAEVTPVVARHRTDALAHAYLEYLYSDPAQDLAARHYLRVRSDSVMRKYQGQFKSIKLFTVDEVAGGWRAAQQAHFADGALFDQIMSQAGRH